MTHAKCQSYCRDVDNLLGLKSDLATFQQFLGEETRRANGLIGALQRPLVYVTDGAARRFTAISTRRTAEQSPMAAMLAESDKTLYFSYATDSTDSTDPKSKSNYSQIQTILAR
ncbi:hypothetical protein DSL72_002046 [Monilinia vaccinii-corymbosi]|uniref:Uncharacterized protein n=1 Tax=Monilinia vaccinii-corymbosi TaxID=61207 RepID=A0A8A3PBI9_9HELO|nr:hypothetical protein DSL72_002046 [Monilinia vaccinii-corymbosi]